MRSDTNRRRRSRQALASWAQRLGIPRQGLITLCAGVSFVRLIDERECLHSFGVPDDLAEGWSRRLRGSLLAMAGGQLSVISYGATV